MHASRARPERVENGGKVVKPRTMKPGPLIRWPDLSSCQGEGGHEEAPPPTSGAAPFTLAAGAPSSNVMPWPETQNPRLRERRRRRRPGKRPHDQREERRHFSVTLWGLTGKRERKQEFKIVKLKFLSMYITNLFST